MSAIAFLALLSGAVAFNTDFADKAWTTKPIAKVVGLLKDMSTQLEAEQKQDADMYSEMGCWCKTNDEEKTKAIHDANKKIPELASFIEKMSALSLQLDTDIQKLNKDFEKHTSGLEQATALRTKESSEFTADESDMKATIGSLGGAVEALGKAQGGSLLQVRKTIAGHMQKHEEMLQKVLSPQQRDIMMSFIEQGSQTVEKSGKPGPSASGAIFGTLKQMKETFEGNLADTQKEESQNSDQYSALKDAKETEIAAVTKMVQDKTVEMADANEKHAEAKTDKENTEAQLAADITFLDNVKKMCATADEDYEARSKVRGEEIMAVGEAIAILTEDESKDSFGASGDSGFIQISAHHRRMNNKQQRQEEASRLLIKAGTQTHSSQLLQLAAAVKGPKDAMKSVVEQMDALVVELKKTGKEEVAKKDYCDKEIHTNEMETKAKTDQKEDLDQLIANLDQLVKTRGEEIKELETFVFQTQTELKRASEDRIKESREFQQTVNEQVATQTVLQKALDRLNAFYASKKASLVQKSSKGMQTPPGQMKYKKQSGASGALGMLGHIIEESKDVEAKAVKGEQEASEAYTTFATDSNAAITAAQESQLNKREEIAKSKKALIDAKADLMTSIDDLLSLGEASAAVHQDCDFLLKHFTERQESRASETEGIQAAKAVLSGAKMFLQVQ